MKVGIKDETPVFKERLERLLNNKFGKEFDFFYFPTLKKAQTAAGKIGLDVLLLDDVDRLNSNIITKIPRQCVTVWLSENMAVPKNSSYPTVFRYQSAEEWRNFLLSICRKLKDETRGYRDDFLQETKVCIFTAGGGGVGASAAAAAFCWHCAESGVPVIYLNFESIPSTNNFFTGESNYDFGDVICALKTSKDSLYKIMKQSIAQDASGVDFINPPKIISDMFTLSGEEIVTLCEKIDEMKKYKAIVLDIGFDATERIVLPFINSNMTVVVSDGSQVANEKAEVAINILPLMCGINVDEVGEKIYLLYNRFDLKEGKVIENQSIGKLGGINKMTFSENAMLLKSISHLSPFDKIAENLKCMNQ